MAGAGYQGGAGRRKLSIVVAVILCLPILLLLPGVGSAAIRDWQRLVPPMTPKAHALETAGYVLFAAGLFIRAIFFTVLLTGRRAWRLQDAITQRVRPRLLGAPVTLLIYLLLYQFALLPLAYVGYRIYHHYGISVQSTGRWFLDLGRGWAVQDCILIPVILLLLFAMRRWPRVWWIIAAIGVAVVSAGVVYLAPLVIDPLYHHFTPLRDPGLRDAILALARKAHVHVNGVYVGKFSSTTTEGNAYVTGLGSSQRIVLWDTILKKYTPHEIQSIVAHELGHYALHHIAKGVAIGSAGSLLLFLITAGMVDRGMRGGWLRNRGEPATIVPAAALILALNVLALPATNFVSRTMESQADAFSLRITHHPDWFIAAMQRLSRQDYSDPWPNPFEKYVFYTHPSISERIFAAVHYAEEHRLKT